MARCRQKNNWEDLLMNYINKGNKATKTGFGEGVLAAAQANPNVVGLGADITASVGMNLLQRRSPSVSSRWALPNRIAWLRLRVLP